MLDMFNRTHTNPEGKNTKKPYKWILIDSLIIGGIAMAASMPSTVPTAVDLYVMLKAFVGSLLIQLAIERGIKRD